MLTKRIIPCLDVKEGRTVKGVNFVGLRDAGDPIELAAKYSEEGADELVFLDITATHEKRKTLSALVQNVAKAINIPFTVGGGISSVEDAYVVLRNGADKVAVNSAAVRNPQLLNELYHAFGRQCVVLAVDGKWETDHKRVYVSGGRKATDKELMSWIDEAVDRGAGEILYTSMDHDGTKAGFDNEILAQINAQIPVPVIASGGAGTIQHFADAFNEGHADAALAASIFHFNEIGLEELKTQLKELKINVRC